MTHQEQERIERAGKLSVVANREFLSENRELLVSFDRVALQQSMLATIRLNYSEVIRTADPDISFYLQLQEKAFLNLYDRGAITPIASITPLGDEAIVAMRKRTGIGVEALPIPEPTLTPAQELESTVRSDWKNLPSKQIRQKINNDRAYRECFERISADFDSQVTKHTVIPGV